MKRPAILLVLVLLVSCTSNTIFEKPKDLIPRDTMVILIQEMMIASSAKFVNNINSERDIHYMAFVYEKYKIDSSRFNRSNTYYISTIDEYIKLFREVKDSLEKKSNSFKRLKKRKDSIRRDSIIKLRRNTSINLDTITIDNLP
ncbi:MAG: DUF4296 domain-containing protein [Polaribacter sp.]|jgi:hypothetical protein